MKNPILIFVGVGLVIAGASFALFRGQDDTSSPQQPVLIEQPQTIDKRDIVAEIRMDDNRYEPETVTIHQGQAIRFVNADTKPYWPASNIHPTHEIYSEFDPKKAVPPGETWIFRFDQIGSWRMHDHLYPFIKGMITVEE